MGVEVGIGRQFLIAGCLYIGQLLCGYGLGWPAPVIALLQNPELTILETPITVEQASWIVSSSFVGFLTGLGFMILAIAKHIAIIYLGRIVVGFGTGMLFVTNLVYLGELASIRNRGTLLTLTGFSSTCGTLIAYSVGPFVSYAAISWIAAGIVVAYMFALGAYFFLYDNEYTIADDLQWMALTSVVLYFIAYFSGFGIIPNTFIGEMFTNNCRGFSSTFTVTIGWVFGFGVSAAFGYMLPAWGPSVTFWIFAGASVLACLFSAIFVPETKGKSLLEIQEILSR
ncbi:hypothetical protein HF086_017200 [Spodoptera exigua]|uniref:Major facilitator superfamily (MFS) profile domain-containing protein n=1 Tax=Spodoptera exigua TaxID=7107 RepID=A0A922MDZ6_SPOEX|nr:hypothetical protein HF086_017200 [Spodoptera exigua]